MEILFLMTRIQYASAAILILVSAIFLATHIYAQNYSPDNLKLAKPVSQVTSTLIPDFSSTTDQVAFESGYTGITEERSISIVLVFSVLLCLIVVAVLRSEKKQIGATGIQDQLTAGSVILAITIIVTLVRQLQTYA